MEKHPSPTESVDTESVDTESVDQALELLNKNITDFHRLKPIAFQDF